MIKASYEDKYLVADILTKSFNDNWSVNYVVKQDKHRIRRINCLMRYSFDICYQYGEVFLSADKKACALILLPDKKRTTIRSILWDIKLAISSIGLQNVIRTMRRETAIKRLHPNTPFAYLWFIGVYPSEQNKGIGTALLENILTESTARQRPVYLETSSTDNLTWYEKFGFHIFHQLNFGFVLYLLKREITQQQ